MSESLAGRRVAVLGFARQGASVARALVNAGATVRVLDRADTAELRAQAAALAGIEAILGREDADDLTGCELIVTSAGVPPTSAWHVAALQIGVPVWSDVELAQRLGANLLIGITGTNGKTTTTEMALAALTACGRGAVAGGNIGVGIADILSAPAVVAELSSFQLYSIDQLRVRVAVLLNIGRDHLDWHGTFDAYVAAKARIVENQTGEDTVVHLDDDVCIRAIARARSQRVPFAIDRVPDGGAGVADGWIVVPQGRVVEVARLRAKGRPNLADAIAAAAAVCALGCDTTDVGEALASYQPSPHRIEHVAVIDGVTYINDSKATDPHAALAAMEELDSVVLIAGGRNKGLDLGELTVAAPKLRAVIAIGEAQREIIDAFAATAVRAEAASSMEEAVQRAAKLAEAGDTVLLAPACASWDMFNGYAARGEAFRSAVTSLQGRSA
jgi:UDP-N-acetylmuramoylalanine--D-glutamate ligase